MSCGLLPARSLRGARGARPRGPAGSGPPPGRAAPPPRHDRADAGRSQARGRGGPRRRHPRCPVPHPRLWGGSCRPPPAAVAPGPPWGGSRWGAGGTSHGAPHAHPQGSGQCRAVSPQGPMAPPRHAVPPGARPPPHPGHGRLPAGGNSAWEMRPAPRGWARAREGGGCQMCVWQEPVAFEDVAVYLSRTEWDTITAEQRELYCSVMRDNYRLLTSLGYPGPKPDILYRMERGEEPWVCSPQSPARWEGPSCPSPGCDGAMSLLEVPPWGWWPGAGVPEERAQSPCQGESWSLLFLATGLWSKELAAGSGCAWSVPLVLLQPHGKGLTRQTGHAEVWGGWGFLSSPSPQRGPLLQSPSQPEGKLPPALPQQEDSVCSVVSSLKDSCTSSDISRVAARCQ
ncbi:uncharacterized protein LOC115611011 isoform X8 [Strigops habroptila]|uniref:uncharacterized protein LOC115611011 isoform X8 n=1 Tax=Strigops habroptila TaxID=2489341 RepID=UPI0011CEFE59|nr:uncharacterized protein LOC115611011 isoform X8 [Strigops habroptila]